MVLKTVKIERPMNQSIAKELELLTLPEVKYLYPQTILTLPTPQEPTEEHQLKPGKLTMEQLSDQMVDDELVNTNYQPPLTVIDKPAKTVLEDDIFLNKKNIIIGSVILLVVIIALVVIFKSKK